jgi:hypothetical protein
MSAIGMFNPTAAGQPAPQTPPTAGEVQPAATGPSRGVSQPRLASAAVGTKPWVDANAFGSIGQLADSAALAYRVGGNGGITIIGNHRPFGPGAGVFLRGFAGTSLFAPYAGIKQIGEQLIDRMATSGVEPRPFQVTFQLSPQIGLDAADRSQLADTMIGLKQYAAERGLDKAFFDFRFSK